MGAEKGQVTASCDCGAREGLLYGTRDWARGEGEGLEGSLEKPSGKENGWRNENTEGCLALHPVLQPLLLPGREGMCLLGAHPAWSQAGTLQKDRRVPAGSVFGGVAGLEGRQPGWDAPGLACWWLAASRRLQQHLVGTAGNAAARPG